MRHLRVLSHWANTMLHIRPAYEPQPLAEIGHAGVGLLLLTLFVIVLGVPDGITYMTNELHDPAYQGPWLLAAGLILLLGSASYVLGRIAAILIYWFRRHIAWRRPARTLRNMRRTYREEGFRALMAIFRTGKV